jgi:hypothetical protein
MASVTAQHVHKWDIDKANHGVCSCGEERDFPEVPWYDAKSEQKNRALFNSPGRVSGESKLNKKREVLTKVEIERTNTMISGSDPFPGKWKPVVTVTPPLSPMPAETQKAITEMAGKAVGQLVKARGKRGPYVKKVKKSAIAPKPKFNPDEPNLPDPFVTVEKDSIDRICKKLQALEFAMDILRTPKLPPLPDFAAVPDDCKAKWFDLYGKLLEVK